MGASPTAAELLRILRAASLSLATAESCTGGLISARLTGVAGSSDVFLGGVVAYGNEAKIRILGVEPELLREHGAVSEPVARAMASGARVLFGASCALSSTGIAGPGGGSPGKPVGLVFIAACAGGAGAGIRAARLELRGDRALVREQTVAAAFRLLAEVLTDLSPALRVP